MISPLAREDYEELIAAGLPATLDDFDRLNAIALRLTDGKNTTAANFPRFGLAGGIAFHRPTCQAISWYLQIVDNLNIGIETKNLCWFYALAHGRVRGAFDDLTDEATIVGRVSAWAAKIPATGEEIARACKFAAHGFDDAVAEKSPAKVEEDKAKTSEEKSEESLANLMERVTTASALTGIKPDDLMTEIPSRLEAMIDAVRELNKNEFSGNESRLRVDYDYTFRAIKMRLIAEKEAAENGK